MVNTLITIKGYLIFLQPLYQVWWTEKSSDWEYALKKTTIWQPLSFKPMLLIDLLQKQYTHKTFSTFQQKASLSIPFDFQKTAF